MATEYEYTKLKDLEPGSKFYNVYGVVKFYREKRRTRGPDWNMVIVLTDDSLGWDEKITFNLFLKDPSSFPSFSQLGSIVRFHRIKMNVHGDQKQGLSSPGFAALVFEHGGEELKSTRPNYTYTDRDKFRVKELFKWSSQFVEVELAKNFAKVCDISPNQFFGFHCQVVGYVKVNENHVVLKVWDGTTPKTNLQILKILEDNDSRVQIDAVIYPHVQDFLVDVSVFDDHVKETDAILLGDYVTFHNLRASVPIPFRDENPPSKVELWLQQGNSYGRSVQTMSDTQAHSLREELNNILEGVGTDQDQAQSKASSSNRCTPPVVDRDDHNSEMGQKFDSSEKSEPNNTSSPKKRSFEEYDIVNNACNIIENHSTMRVYDSIAFWSDRLRQSTEVKILPNLHPELHQFTGITSQVEANVTMDMDFSQTIILFCQHCHFLSSLPDLENHPALLPGKIPKRYKLDRKVKKSRPEPMANIKPSTSRHMNQIIDVPLTEFCKSVYNVKKVKLKKGDWMLGARPCLEMFDTGHYYLCPNCERRNEDNTRLLKYFFHLTMTLEDETGKVDVLVWDDRLKIDDDYVSACDVIGNNVISRRYRRWLGQFNVNTQKATRFTCIIRVHSRGRTRGWGDKLFQLMSMEPTS